MAKNPFKKKSLTDTLVNVGIGGAANVAIDYVWDAAGLDSSLSFESVKADTVKNAIKIIGGAVAGSMITNKYGRAAADGVATVGVSNLVSDLISGSEGKEESGTTGLPSGTIGNIHGRYRAGSAAYARASRGRGHMAGLDDFQTA